MSAPLIVAIDGPSGVGKSTAARRLAKRLEVPFLDTGAMYRSIALKVLRSELDPTDRVAVEALAVDADVRLERRGDGSFEVLLEGEPVEPYIRAPEVGEAASAISVHPGVRRRLVALQQEAARHWGGVLEGRDIGTRVFPDTPHKFFLDARPDVRGRRRYEELQATGRGLTYEQVVDEINRRDHRDRTREDSPLTRDDSYTFVDTSDLAIDDVVEEMARAIDVKLRASA
ncbi:MAG TPA: (d)CMP kinase [Thermoanaerobaculia bacterium]|nr:(d)CMP kinase [Thermoanaerobaculia bacterium]